LRSIETQRHTTDGPQISLDRQLAELDAKNLLTDLADYRVDYSDEDEPLLLDKNGVVVDTWRENYPYPERMSREEYDHDKRLLQIELLKLQKWIKAKGERLVVLFEGRDARPARGHAVRAQLLRLRGQGRGDRRHARPEDRRPREGQIDDDLSQVAVFPRI
jgi:polyphosphate kinase